MSTARQSAYRGSSALDNVLAWSERAVANPAVSYLLIFALQLRLIWDVWLYKDLVFGDTASYFTEAAGWANHLQDDAVWSPLYTNFWGTILAVVNNVYTAAMVHRVVIVLAASILVLALMRRLLNPALALLVTVWWTVVPQNYNVLYEVHLFGLLPILIAAWIVARNPSRTALGIALAVLAGSALLVRNEMIVATIIFAAALAVHEVRKARTQSTPASTYIRSYGVPLAIVCLLAGGMYWRSGSQGHRFLSDFRIKQDLNMCQVYAFNFQQHHPGRFVGNPFTECAPLMQHTFGHPMLNLAQATIANPRAVGGMVKWNLQLWPSGLQVALFNATSTGYQPDYIPVETHRPYALILSVVVILLLIAGAWAIGHDLDYWRREWLPARRWALTVLGAVAITTVYIVLTQRPRPEYMYGLTVGLIALTGVCSWALLRRVNGVRVAAPVAIMLTFALVVALPSYYHKGLRPLHDAVERLEVVRSKLQLPRSVLIASGFNAETCEYLADSIHRYCSSPSWGPLQAKLAAGVPIQQVLNQSNATAIYADPVLLSNPAVAKLVARPQLYGWRLVAGGAGEGGPWRVLVRAS